MLSGQNSQAVCNILKVKQLPRSLEIYMFCSPALDFNFRCLPREGGYLDQDNYLMNDFRIIENKLVEWQKKEMHKMKNKNKNTNSNSKTTKL